MKLINIDAEFSDNQLLVHHHDHQIDSIIETISLHALQQTSQSMTEVKIFS